MTELLVQRPTGFSISHVFNTSIQTALTGEEKRSSINQNYLTNMNIKYCSGNYDNSSAIRGKLYFGTHEPWIVPIWSDKTYLTAPGTASLTVADASYRHFKTNGYVAMYDEESGTVGYGIVSGITGNVISLSQYSSTFPTDTLIMPAVLCRLNQSNSINRRVREFDEWELSFEEAYEEDRDYSADTYSYTGTTYLGYDIFTPAPKSGLKFSTRHDYDLLKYYGKGTAYSWFNSADAILSLEAGYILNSKATIWDAITFFNNKMGRYGKFWVPTWNKDYKVTAAYSSTDTTITVDSNNAYVDYADTDIINKHVMIMFPDKTRVYREIESSTATTITLDAPIGKTEATSFGNTYISFLIFCRFDLDELKMEYINENIAEFELSFKGLLGETP